MFKNKTEHKLWLYVIGTMAIVAILWGAVFYPQSLKKSDAKTAAGFTSFKDKLNGALSVFKKPAPPASAKNNDVEVLRERVFGDSAQKDE
ncbi:MAG: hypothetical protein AAB880_01215 [Patescibacteria group bacterium]